MAQPDIKRAAADDEAAEWFMRQDNGPLTSEDKASLAAWLRDPENCAAYDRVQQTWDDLDLTPESTRTKLRRDFAPTRIRTRFPWAEVALAASLLVAVLAPQAMLAWRADATTATGEIKTITLADGSRLTLDTASAVAIDYEIGQRRVTLLKGAAEFQVAPDAGHPFVVFADGGSVRALGTIFTVRRDRDGVAVTGIEHQVQVMLSNKSVTLGPGEQLHYRLALGPVGAVAEDADSWVHGHLLVEHQRLAAVATELSRYTHGRILVLGEAGDIQINGVFPLTDPVEGLAVLGQNMGLKVTRLSPWLTILRR